MINRVNAAVNLTFYLKFNFNSLIFNAIKMMKVIVKNLDQILYITYINWFYDVDATEADASTSRKECK